MNLEESRRLYGEPRIGDSVAHTSLELKRGKAIITKWCSSSTNCNIRYVDNKVTGVWFKINTYTVGRPVPCPPTASPPLTNPLVNGVNVLKANAEVLLNSLSICQAKVKELTDLGITSTRVDEEIKKVEKTIAKLVKLLDAS